MSVRGAAGARRWLVALALGLLVQGAGAHGGRVQLAKVPAGPYLVSAWTLPDPPQVGALDVSVAVMEPRTERPRLDATGRLTATPGAGDRAAIVRDLERGTGGNPLLYHALLDVPAAGPWRIAIVVDGPDGQGQAAFDLAVERDRSLVWTLAAGILAAVALLAWVVAGWRRPRA